MKLNEYLLFMLILICSLININVTDSPIEIRNLEPVKYGKRTLDEQIDNYIIIQFNKNVSYEKEKQKFLLKNNEYISYIINGDEKIYSNSYFTLQGNKKIEVHFNRTITSLDAFFNAATDENLKYMISGNFCHFDTSSVTKMGGMFYGCSSLQTLYLSNFNTSLVTYMGAMFYNCSSLKTLYLSNFNTSLVRDMSYMFYNCSSLHTLYLSNFNTTAVTNMASMFDRCSSLKYLIISNVNFDNIENN